MQVTQLIWVSEKLCLHYLHVFGGQIWLWMLSILLLDARCANTLKTSTNVLLVCCNRCLFQMINFTHVLLISWLICLRLMGKCIDGCGWQVWQVEPASTLQSRGWLAHSTVSSVAIFQQWGQILWCTTVCHTWPQHTFDCGLLEGVVEYVRYTNTV